MDRPGEELQQQMEEAGEEWTDGRTGAQTGGQYDRSRRADRGKTQRDGEEEGEMELHGRTPDTRANTRADIEERWTDRDQDEMGALRYGRENFGSELTAETRNTAGATAKGREEKTADRR
jgi:hypothetical protein